MHVQRIQNIPLKHLGKNSSSYHAHQALAKSILSKPDIHAKKKGRRETKVLRGIDINVLQATSTDFQEDFIDKLEKELSEELSSLIPMSSSKDYQHRGFRAPDEDYNNHENDENLNIHENDEDLNNHENYENFNNHENYENFNNQKSNVNFNNQKSNVNFNNHKSNVNFNNPESNVNFNNNENREDSSHQENFNDHENHENSNNHGNFNHQNNEESNNHENHEHFNNYGNHEDFNNQQNFNNHENFNDHENHENFNNHENDKNFNNQENFNNHENYNNHENHENYNNHGNIYDENHKNVNNHENHEEFDSHENHEDFNNYENHNDFNHHENDEDLKKDKASPKSSTSKRPSLTTTPCASCKHVSDENKFLRQEIETLILSNVTSEEGGCIGCKALAIENIILKEKTGSSFTTGNIRPAFPCDDWDGNTRTCILDRNIGDTVTFVLAFHKKANPEIQWAQEFHLYQSRKTKQYIIDPENPLWNLVIGSRGHEMRISPITELDIHFNYFSATIVNYNSKIHRQRVGKTHQLDTLNFKIRVMPTDLGFVYPGESLTMNMKRVSLPPANMRFRWYLEKEGEYSSLPSNMRLSPSGGVLTVSELRKEQEGILVCAVFTNKGFFATMQRFLVKEMNHTNNMLLYIPMPDVGALRRRRSAIDSAESKITDSESSDENEGIEDDYVTDIHLFHEKRQVNDEQNSAYQDAIQHQYLLPQSINEQLYSPGEIPNQQQYAPPQNPNEQHYYLDQNANQQPYSPSQNSNEQQHTTPAQIANQQQYSPPQSPNEQQYYPAHNTNEQQYSLPQNPSEQQHAPPQNTNDQHYSPAETNQQYPPPQNPNEHQYTHVENVNQQQYQPPQSSNEQQYSPDQNTYQQSYAPPQNSGEQQYSPPQNSNEQQYYPAQIANQQQYAPPQNPNEPQYSAKLSTQQPQSSNEQQYSPDQILHQQQYSPPQIPNYQQYSPPQNPNEQQYVPPQNSNEQHYSPAQTTNQQQYSPPQNSNEQQYTSVQIATQQTYQQPQSLNEQQYIAAQIAYHQKYYPPQNTNEQRYSASQSSNEQQYSPAQTANQQQYYPPQSAIYQQYSPYQTTNDQNPGVQSSSNQQYYATPYSSGQQYTAPQNSIYHQYPVPQNANAQKPQNVYQYQIQPQAAQSAEAILYQQNANPINQPQTHPMGEYKGAVQYPYNTQVLSPDESSRIVQNINYAQQVPLPGESQLQYPSQNQQETMRGYRTFPQVQFQPGKVETKTMDQNLLQKLQQKQQVKGFGRPNIRPLPRRKKPYPTKGKIIPKPTQKKEEIILELERKPVISLLQKAQDRLSKMIANCTIDQHCSADASCIREDPKLAGFCRCSTGFQGSGIFCWEEIKVRNLISKNQRSENEEIGYLVEDSTETTTEENLVFKRHAVHKRHKLKNIGYYFPF